MFVYHLTRYVGNISKLALVATHINSDFQKFENEPIEVQPCKQYQRLISCCMVSTMELVLHTAQTTVNTNTLMDRHNAWGSRLRILAALAGTTSIMICKVTMGEMDGNRHVNPHCSQATSASTHSRSTWAYVSSNDRSHHIVFLLGF